MGNEMGNINTSELREEEDNKSIETEGKAAQELIYSNGLKEKNNFGPTPENIDYNGNDSEITAVLTNGKEEDMVNTSSQDLECEDSAEHEPKQVEVCQSEQERIIGSSHIEEKCHESDNRISDNTEGSVVSDLRLNDEQFEVQNEDGIVETKIQEKNDGGIFTSNGANSLETQDMDVSIPEETELIAINGDSNHADNDLGSEVDTADEKENPVDDTARNGILKAQEVNSVRVGETFVARPSFENGIHCEPASSGGRLGLDPEPVNLTAELSIPNGTYRKDESENYESGEKEPVMEQSLESEDNTEARVLAEDLQQITASEYEDAQVRDESIPEAKKVDTEALGPSIETSVPEIEKQNEADAVQLHESESIEAPEFVEASFPAALLQFEDQQPKTATKCEDARVFASSASELKLESSSELLEAVDSPFYATTTSMETSIPAVDLPIGNPEKAEAVLVHTKILTEYSHSTKACNEPIPENLIGEQKETVGESDRQTENVKTLIPDNEERESTTKCENAQVLNNSTSELKLESNSELVEEVNSPFYATTTSMVTLIPAIDLSIENQEKAEAVLVRTIETPKILTENNPSGSENHSTKACNEPIPGNLPGETENVKTVVPDNEEQESTARFSMESIPDRAEMRKSPSFGIDLRIEAAKTKESDQTPLLYQNNNTNEEDNINLHSSLLPVEYNRESLKYQQLPPEEKAFSLDKSGSNKLKSPFLGEPKQQDNKQNPAKDKHRRRSSLFTNCMCCTTVLN